MLMPAWTCHTATARRRNGGVRKFQEYAENLSLRLKE
jgi:hypothetical protein